VKRPWFEFYPGDWLRDTELQQAPLWVKGVWTQMLCRMYQAKIQGQLTGPVDELASLVGCTVPEMEAGLKELYRRKIADFPDLPKPPNNDDGKRDISVTCHGVVTVVSRRMRREAKSREQARLRKQRQRSHAGITDALASKAIEAERKTLDPPLQSPPSQTGGNGGKRKPKNPIPKDTLRHWFETVWSRHPRKRGNKEKAYQRFSKTVTSPDRYQDCFKAVENYAAEMKRLGTPEDRIAYASTWFGQWETWIDVEPVATKPWDSDFEEPR